MDSTKSFSVFACALAYVCLACFSLAVSAAPVVVPDNGGCGTGCSLDITLIYENSAPITSNLPSIFQDILSKSDDQDVEVTVSSRHNTLLRDIGFHPRHSDSDPDESELKSDSDSDTTSLKVFTEYLKVKAASAAACTNLPIDLLTPPTLAGLLDVSTVISLFAVPSSCSQKSDPSSGDESEVAPAPLTIAGTAAVVISDFEDGSFDKFAEITTESGAVFVVGGPDSDDAVERGAWSAIRTGDGVELHVSAEEFSPADPVVGMGMGMGMAYNHAPSRHRLLGIARHTPKKEDKSTPSGVTKLIAIRVVYTDKNPDSVCTTSCLQNNLWTGTHNVDGVYRDNSYGTMSIPQDQGLIVTVTLSVASTSYSSCNDLGNIGAAADAAVAAQYPNVVLSGYTNKLYLTQAICGIGVAYVGGNPGRAYVNSASADTFAHELGHNFGMQHANRDPGDDNVIDESYGDRSCIMGYSTLTLRGFNMPHRIDNGWIPSSAILDLNACTGAQTITLAPVSHAHYSGAIVAVRAVRRLLGRYFISFRNSDGYDGQLASSYINEVHIHYQIIDKSETELVAVLTVGQSWSQAQGDLSVAVSSISSSGAVVVVNYCRPSTFTAASGSLTCGSTVSGTNVGAANIQGYSSGDVLYSVNFQGYSSYTLSTCGSSLDTVLRLYSDAMFEQLAFCDNCGSCSSNTRNAVLSGITGTGNFMVAVEGFNTAQGSFVLSLTCSGPISATSATPTRSPQPSQSASPSKAAASHTPSPSKAVASHTPSPSKAAASHTPSPSKAAASHTPSPSKGAVSHTASPSKAAASHTPSPSKAAVSHTASPSRAVSHSASPSRPSSPLCGTLASKQPCTSNNQCKSCKCNRGKCK